MTTPLLSTRHLTVAFGGAGGLFRAGGTVRAVTDVSFALYPGEALALVGESGSGKTSLARAILGLHPHSTGEIRFRGQDTARMTASERQAMRRAVQMVFQDPFGSLDPRLPIGAVIAEPLRIHGIGNRASRADRVRELLGLVGLPADAVNRYPHQFSGGQRQRVAIARALAPGPAAIIADEPLSALDMSIQSQILNLLSDLRGRLGVSYLLISHDLAAVHHLADRVAAMYLGRIVEVAPRDALFAAPAHPYSAALLDAVPRIGTGKRIPGHALIGDMPSPMAPPPGCAFHPRCPRALARCAEEVPALIRFDADREVACHNPLVAGGA
jgi:oligopeptide/dipeptide ABC transporter ATP-binding protein